MMMGSEFGFDGDMFDDDYGMDMVPAEGKNPHADGDEAASAGVGAGGKSITKGGAKGANIVKGKPRTNVKRSLTADQLAAAQVSFVRVRCIPWLLSRYGRCTLS